jgi:hypothetical protein
MQGKGAYQLAIDSDSVFAVLPGGYVFEWWSNHRWADNYIRMWGPKIDARHNLTEVSRAVAKANRVRSSAYPLYFDQGQGGALFVNARFTIAELLEQYSVENPQKDERYLQQRIGELVLEMRKAIETVELSMDNKPITHTHDYWPAGARR